MPEQFKFFASLCFLSVFTLSALEVTPANLIHLSLTQAFFVFRCQIIEGVPDTASEATAVKTGSGQAGVHSVAERV